MQAADCLLMSISSVLLTVLKGDEETLLKTGSEFFYGGSYDKNIHDLTVFVLPLGSPDVPMNHSLKSFSQW